MTTAAKHPTREVQNVPGVKMEALPPLLSVGSTQELSMVLHLFSCLSQKCPSNAVPRGQHHFSITPPPDPQQVHRDVISAKASSGQEELSTLTRGPVAGKGGEKCHQSLNKETYEFLSTPSSGLESAQRNSVPSEVLYKHCSFVPICAACSSSYRWIHTSTPWAPNTSLS